MSTFVAIEPRRGVGFSDLSPIEKSQTAYAFVILSWRMANHHRPAVVNQSDYFSRGLQIMNALPRADVSACKTSHLSHAILVRYKSAATFERESGRRQDAGARGSTSTFLEP
ncbi:hypothetical protein GR204_33315 [Rhizobium leguminosarum]|uniref:Uncharacterized protein n=1 Tax=Rhizobium leguminosarum TaxID=384 RepID=A0A6P0BFZ7_RHILE|nr:hypothetical protein [Rhizobium leguminosarum]NEI38763.1 hypothetical protein [Rhizobium leguminosarum]NEI45411.1 hypothetical protein [Rhizobium leguminosarum]